MGDTLTRLFDGTTAIHNPVGYKVPMGGIALSFEADEQGAIRIRMPFRCKITRVRSIVTKALSDTNAGSVTFASSDGDLAELEHALSAAVGSTRTADPVANNTIEKDADLTITTAKVKVGGKVSVDIDILRFEGP